MTVLKRVKKCRMPDRYSGYSTLRRQKTDSPKTLVSVYETSRRHTAEGSNVYGHPHRKFVFAKSSVTSTVDNQLHGVESFQRT